MSDADFLDLRRADATLIAAVLHLNAAHEQETSPLTEARLRELLGDALIAPARADGLAFMIAFDETAAYDSPNFQWFRARYPRFAYVDRVIVSPDLRGQGVGRALYRALFRVAHPRGVPVTCEVNSVPPNPVSDAFHAALGFKPVGRAQHSAGKEVRYFFAE